jgi:uncharacterized protein involved in exopolysaccharide biosynthesis
MTVLNNKMVDLRICYDEAVTDTKELGEKWRPSSSTLVRLKSECDELSQALKQF